MSFTPKKGTDAIPEFGISDSKRWLQADLLKLNDNKTEFILFGSAQNCQNCPSLSISFGENKIVSTGSVKILGAQFDRKLAMESFVFDKIKISMFYLKNISRIRRYLNPESTKILVNAYIISRLDYANSLLYGINPYFSTANRTKRR